MKIPKKLISVFYTSLIIFSLVPLTHNLMYKDTLGWSGPEYFFFEYNNINYNDMYFFSPLRIYQRSDGNFIGLFMYDDYPRHYFLGNSDSSSDWSDTEDLYYLFEEYLVGGTSLPSIAELSVLNNGSYMLGAMYDRFIWRNCFTFIQSPDGINWNEGFFSNNSEIEIFKTGCDRINFNFFEQNGEIKIFTGSTTWFIYGNNTHEVEISIWNIERVADNFVFQQESNITFEEIDLRLVDDYMVYGKYFTLQLWNETTMQNELVLVSYENETWEQLNIPFSFRSVSGFFKGSFTKLFDCNDQLYITYCDTYGLDISKFSENYFTHIGKINFDDNETISISETKRIGVVDDPWTGYTTIVRNAETKSVILKNRPSRVNRFHRPPPSDIGVYQEKYDSHQAVKFSFSFIAIFVASLLPFRKFITKEIKAIIRIRKA